MAFSNKNKKNKKIVVLLVTALLLVGCGSIVYISQGRFSDQVTPTSTMEDKESISYEPPTEEEKQEVDATKERLASKTEPENTPAPVGEDGRKQVTPTITYAGLYGESVEVAGFISNILESDGTCTASLERNGQKLSATSRAITDVSATVCPAILLEKSKFTSGTWVLRLDYTSSSSTGSSATQNLELSL